MRKRVPFSTVLLFIAIQSALLIDVMHTPTGHGPAVNPHTIPNPQGATRMVPLRDDDQTARQLLAAGHLQEAQDEYLRLLLFRPPDDSKALQGLVTARRRMAHDNLAILRQQADTYKRALTSGIETNEHYTQESLRFIYIATLIAAAQVETERSANTTARPSAGPPEPRLGRSATASSGAVPPGPAHSFPSGSPRASHVVTSPPTRPAAILHDQATSEEGIPPQRQPGGSRTFPARVLPQVQPSQQPEGVPTRLPEHGALQAPRTQIRPVPAATLESSSPERTVGTLGTVDCQQRTLGINGSHGRQEFSAIPTVVIYAGTEKLSQFCGLQRFVGARIFVWGAKVGALYAAGRIYVVVPSARVALSRAGGQEADPPLVLLAGQPDPVTTPDPSGNDPKGGRSERTGIIITKIDSAALVLSRDGVHPLVITSGTRIVGLRTTFGAVTRLDSVRASGRVTPTGTLIVDLIEVTKIPSRRQVQQVNALGTGSLVFNDLSRVQGIVGMTSAADGAPVNGGGSMSNGGAAVNAGASVSGGASVSTGGTPGSAGASVSGGASVNAGGTPGTAGASVSGGASVGAGGTKAGASVNGGVSVSGGGVSVAGGLSVGGVGGVPGSGGASGSAGGSSKDSGTGQH